MNYNFNYYAPKRRSKSVADSIQTKKEPQAGVQKKLTVGKPNDKYEQEADRVADKVVSMSGPGPVQRKCADCEAEDKQVQKEPLAAGITQWVPLAPLFLHWPAQTPLAKRR